MSKDQHPSNDEDIQILEGMDEALEDVAQTAAEDAEASPEELGRLLEDARSKADEHWDLVVRAKADLDNLKKRQQKELENARKFALDRFVNDLLGVWDSLELGNQAAQDESADLDKLREGTELTLKLLNDVMHKFGVEQINPMGQPFDPEKHQAMSMQPSDEHEPNTVIAVIQKGFSLNGRLVRPAMVMVSKATTD